LVSLPLAIGDMLYELLNFTAMIFHFCSVFAQVHLPDTAIRSLRQVSSLFKQVQHSIQYQGFQILTYRTTNTPVVLLSLWELHLEPQDIQTPAQLNGNREITKSMASLPCLASTLCLTATA